MHIIQMNSDESTAAIASYYLNEGDTSLRSYAPYLSLPVWLPVHGRDLLVVKARADNSCHILLAYRPRAGDEFSYLPHSGQRSHNPDFLLVARSWQLALHLHKL